MPSRVIQLENYGTSPSSIGTRSPNEGFFVGDFYARLSGTFTVEIQASFNVNSTQSPTSQTRQIEIYPVNLTQPLICDDTNRPENEYFPGMRLVCSFAFGVSQLIPNYPFDGIPFQPITISRDGSALPQVTFTTTPSSDGLSYSYTSSPYVLLDRILSGNLELQVTTLLQDGTAVSVVTNTASPNTYAMTLSPLQFQIIASEGRIDLTVTDDGEDWIDLIREHISLRWQILPKNSVIDCPQDISYGIENEEGSFSESRKMKRT